MDRLKNEVSAQMNVLGYLLLSRMHKHSLGNCKVANVSFCHWKYWCHSLAFCAATLYN